MPALREREDDVPLLAQSFITEFNKKHHTEIEGISEDAALPSGPRVLREGCIREVKEGRRVPGHAGLHSGSRWARGDVASTYLKHRNRRWVGNEDSFRQHHGAAVRLEPHGARHRRA
jgi:transcriptional regulator with GAF, ATPase, and Fis domain